ncbi:molecular chaperone TorD family protein [Sulfuritalea sp.]|uniref:TorD/DmsD family molecular chaperone n=1 Tax=Sulfuritalea sp. TaxID=2480090 RepID=UPI00286EA351|nr:molecular chaperone TorD family protein [Sulfuritalea sp.]
MLKTVLALDDNEEDVAAGETTAVLASPAETIADCRARAEVYRLLCGAFVEEPGSEFIAALRTPAALAELAEAGLRFDADFLDAPHDALIEALAIEYTQQFASSGGFPAVESVRLTGRYKQQPNFDAMQTYKRLGFVLRPGRFEVFADQLGVELMFVAELLDRAANALEQGDAVTQRRLDKEIKRFWTQHLGRWVRGYSRLIERTSEHSFFREMARFLGGFAAEEIEAMGLRIEDRDQARLEVPKDDIRVEFNPNEPVCNGCMTDALSTTLSAPDNVRRLEEMRGLSKLNDLRDPG